MARRTIRQAQDEARAVREREELDGTATAVAVAETVRAKQDGGGTPAHVTADTLQIDVGCGRIGIGEDTVTVPVTVRRADLRAGADGHGDLHELATADRFFCSAALDIVLRLQSAAPRTPTKDLPGMGGTEPAAAIKGSVATKSFRVGVETISTSLSFKRSQIDTSLLGDLSERDCRLSARRLGSARSGEADVDDPGEEPEAGEDAS